MPATYHNGESTVRVCESCDRYSQTFYRALKLGDLGLAMDVFETGNVNPWMPFVEDKRKEVRAWKDGWADRWIL